MPIIQLMRLDKPIGFFLLLWPTLVALRMASTTLNGFVFAIFIVGTLVMRSAGCVANDICDKEFDKKVARCKNRPLASGSVSVKTAIVCLVFLLCLALGLMLLLPVSVWGWSMVALALALLYPTTKRFFWFPQAFLGLAFAWSVPMAYAAVDAPMDGAFWLVFTIALLLPLAYDTLYAMADSTDDAHLPLYSSAKTLQQHAMFFVGVVESSILMLMSLLYMHLSSGGTYLYVISVLALMLIFMHFLLYKKRISPLLAFKAYGWGLGFWCISIFFCK